MDSIKKCQEDGGKWQWTQNDLATKTSPNITSEHQRGKKNPNPKNVL